MVRQSYWDSGRKKGRYHWVVSQTNITFYFVIPTSFYQIVNTVIIIKIEDSRGRVSQKKTID
jgi:hypothetical protein